MERLYRWLIRPLLFLLPAEVAHHFTAELLRWLLYIPGFRTILKKCCAPPPCRVSCLGLTFENPVGLAAGFDKNGRYVRVAEALGFGFIEVGTVTPKPQRGNSRPRLFRLVRDRALINRMGFNNHGVHAMKRHLPRTRRIIVGINIGKNKDTPNEEAWRDYLYCFEQLHELADFFVVNVSSPNTPGLRALQSAHALERILHPLQRANQQRSKPLPILVKLAPDIDPETLEALVQCCRRYDIAGIIATNTTIDRPSLQTPTHIVQAIGPGGLSGAPLHQKSVYIAQQLGGMLPSSMTLIGVGGILSGSDALDFRRAGACLVEIFTGFVYRGPVLLREITLQWCRSPKEIPPR